MIELEVPDKRALKGAKTIVTSEEFKAIVEHLSALQSHIESRSLQSQLLAIESSRNALLTLTKHYFVMIECNYRYAKGRKQIVYREEWPAIRDIIIASNIIEGVAHEI